MSERARARDALAAILVAVVVAFLIGGALWLYWPWRDAPLPDEAKRAGHSVAALAGSDSDYLRDMDYGWGPDEVYRHFVEVAESLGVAASTIAEHPEYARDEIWKAYNRGRNNWIVWSGGNDRFWDFLAGQAYGVFDLLKTISSYVPRREDGSLANTAIRYCGNAYDLSAEDYANYGEYGATNGKRAYADLEPASDDPPPLYPAGYLVFEDDDCVGGDRQWFEVSRDNRWKYLGLVNEPCFEKPAGPDPERFGLWLDRRSVGPDCPPDPFADAQTYGGVEIGGRGKTEGLPVGSYYGEPTGVVGLRLFPNPAFDDKAKERWDAERYYEDEDYWNDPDLVRPYRVGMSCGFCHVGPNPTNPPADPESPDWENLNSNPGAQYFWLDRIFAWNPRGRRENFFYQLFRTSLPGTLDTSLVSSDNINNPRTMNAVYSVASRLKMALKPERLTGGELHNKQFNDYPATELLSAFFEPPDTIRTPHVLKDGADSVGVLGALNRVYLNIGLASEEWVRHFKPLIGSLPFKHIDPIRIADLEEVSTYWNANVEQTPDLALFFLISAQPDRLAAAEDSTGQDYAAKYLGDAAGRREQGKLVFAENCARCHSGKQPPNLCRLGTPCEDGQILPNSAAYFQWMREEVVKPDFLEDNFLSTEVRIPVTELGTNACSPLATNGLEGDIWDNFTSTTYKQLPAVGKLTVHHPVTGEPWEYEAPGGGRGYTRPASLTSLWSTAPYLLNNAVGTFYGEGSVDARMASFYDSIQKMLWPEKRNRDIVLGDTLPGYIQRTTADSYLSVKTAYLPWELRLVEGPLRTALPFLFGEDDELRIGPIPQGTPVGLLANLPFVSESDSFWDRTAYLLRLVRVLRKAKADLRAVAELSGANPVERSAEARRIFSDLVDPLIALSKCPDYVVNRGHYFGSNLSDQDKWALIEFLKTF